MFPLIQIEICEYFAPEEPSVFIWDPPVHEWDPLAFCHAAWYSKWGFHVNDKGLRLRFRASLTQNPHLSGGSQAKVRVDLFCEPLALLGNLVEPIHSKIWILWRGIINLLSSMLYTIKSLRNSVAHNNIIFDTRFKDRKISPVLKKWIEKETGIQNITQKIIALETYLNT